MPVAQSELNIDDSNPCTTIGEAGGGNGGSGGDVGGGAVAAVMVAMVEMVVTMVVLEEGGFWRWEPAQCT